MQNFGAYFERSGFCFHIGCTTQGKAAVLTLYFQNRYERASQARVVVRPSQGFWMNRPRGGNLTLDLECEVGALGVTRIPCASSISGNDGHRAIDATAQSRLLQPIRRARLSAPLRLSPKELDDRQSRCPRLHHARGR